MRLGDAFAGLVRTLARALRPGAGATLGTGADAGAKAPPPSRKPLPQRMADGMTQFSGPALVILSGPTDAVAQEFRDVSRASRLWRQVLARRTVTRHDFAEADHTFSRREWRDRVAQWTVDWVTALAVGGR